MTSSGTRRASATAAAVLPTPVGPAITRSGGFASLIVGKCTPLPRALELPADVVHRQPADDRPAVRAEVRRLRQLQLGDEALHLFSHQRRVGLDGRAARHEGQGAVERGLARLGIAQLGQDGLDQALGLVALEQRGHRAEHDRLRAEFLECEAQPLQRRAPALEQRARRCAELERLRKQEGLRGERGGVEASAHLLEDDALVHHVLVEEEDLVVGRGHDEGVLHLAQHAHAVLGAIDGQQAAGRVPAPQGPHALPQVGRRRRRRRGAAAVGDAKLGGRMRERELAHDAQAGRQFGGAGLEEFESGGRVEEEVVDLHRGTRLGRHEEPLRDDTALAGEPESLGGAARAAADGEARDRTDGRQRFAAETQRRDGVEILVARQLGRGVTLERQRKLLRRHAVTVVGHANERRTAVAQVDRDAPRARVERVLHQLLDDRRRPLHHLAGRDLVDERVGQPTDRHRASRGGFAAAIRAWGEAGSPSLCCHFARRLSASMGVRCVRSSAPSSSAIGSPAGAKKPSCTASPASVVAWPWSSKRASSAFARAITGAGRPASRATWMPYERSVPPGCTLCRNTISSFHSRTATWKLRTPPRRAASWVSSWKCVAKSTLGLTGRSCSASTTAHAMARPSNVEVPRPTSSSSTRLRDVRLLRIDAVSTISTRNVDWPRARLSWAPTRVNRRSIRPSRAERAGTKAPICASTTMWPVCRRYTDLPAMLGPVRITTRASSSRRRSFGVTGSPERASSTGWRPSTISRAPPASTTGRTWPRVWATSASPAVTSSSASARAVASRSAARVATRPRSSSNSAYSSLRRRSSAPSALASYSLSSGVT